MSSSTRSAIEVVADSITLNPTAAITRPTVVSELVGPCEVRATVDGHVVAVDESPAFGGAGSAPSPVEYALVALSASQAIGYRLWSERLGIRVERVEVAVRGELDLRGLVGLDESIPAGLVALELRVTLSGDEPAEVYERLRRSVEDHCPVLGLYANPVLRGSTLTLVQGDR